MMYMKLAFDNIRKNSRTYLPYILTCVFTIAMYYIMKSLSLNPGLKNSFGGDTTQYVLELGSNIIAVFAFVFLFYTNSFLTKNRKKEFGLYNILGMEKRHIAKMTGYESIFTAVISFAGGLGLGILFDKLMYVAVSRLINAEFSLGFYVSLNAVKTTLILFSLLFLLIFLNSLRMIHLSKPIELLNGGSMGEKEPKAKFFTAILGLACLGTGYYMSMTIKNPVLAITLFFAAVILVIIGTYLLFTAGSITYLKILKRNKRYYYKTNHFISVSGMIYRMKQNAVGLANICVLSTMVLVTVSSTASLMAGVEDIIGERYPYQIEIAKMNGGTEQLAEIVGIVQNTAEQENVEITDSNAYSDIQFMAVFDDDTFRFPEKESDFSKINNVHNIYAITAADYSACTETPANLGDDEVILWQNGKNYEKDYFYLFDKKYTIKERTGKISEHIQVNKEICPTFGIVVKDFSDIEKFYREQKKIYGTNASEIYHMYQFNTNLNNEKQTEFSYALEKSLAGPCMLNVRAKQKTETYSLFGGLFFIGIFLGTLFTIATVLIIYYKQISEGYDDKKRFEIMKKVGMSEHEVKKSIRSQVLTVFFMPLIAAGIHTAAAFPLVRKILAMFQLTNVKLFAVCTLSVFLAFAAIYVLVYLLTAKIYYKIVSKREY